MPIDFNYYAYNTSRDSHLMVGPIDGVSGPDGRPLFSLRLARGKAAQVVSVRLDFAGLRRVVDHLAGAAEGACRVDGLEGVGCIELNQEPTGYAVRVDDGHHDLSAHFEPESLSTVVASLNNILPRFERRSS